MLASMHAAFLFFPLLGLIHHKPVASSTKKLMLASNVVRRGATNNGLAKNLFWNGKAVAEILELLSHLDIKTLKIQLI